MPCVESTSNTTNNNGLIGVTEFITVKRVIKIIFFPVTIIVEYHKDWVDICLTSKLITLHSRLLNKLFV